VPTGLGVCARVILGHHLCADSVTADHAEPFHRPPIPAPTRHDSLPTRRGTDNEKAQAASPLRARGLTDETVARA
jgi:hypothetical protein